MDSSVKFEASNCNISKFMGTKGENPKLLVKKNSHDFDKVFGVHVLVTWVHVSANLPHVH